MKKFINYLGEGVAERPSLMAGSFLHQIRRSQTEAEFYRICQEFLDHDQPMKLEPSDPL